jgi:diguanylate cyclase (GGDEF)-like protein
MAAEPEVNEPDARVEQVVDLLARLATGDLDARGERSDRDDELDAVIEGINMLAEELKASQAELEQRVEERTQELGSRTAELESINLDMRRLAELGNLLAACETPEEAYAMIANGLGGMFASLSGAMYLYRSSRNILEPHSSWGEITEPELLDPQRCWALRRGQPHFVEARTPGLSCAHVTERTGDTICIPMSAHGETIGMLHLMGHDHGADGMAPLSPGKRQLAVPVAEQISLAMANIQLRQKLRIQALRDPLTGLYNRRFADEWIERETARTSRNHRRLGIIMLDVDHFKQVNDLHGHDAGDELLKAVAEVFQSSLRSDDVPCRYGGEEFLVLVSDIDGATLLERTERLRRSVGEIRVEYRGALLPSVTVSAG